MKIRYVFSVFTLILFSIGCGSTESTQDNKDILMAHAIKPYGRYFLNKDQNLELISSAVHFGFSFTGNVAQIFASNSYSGGHNYLQYVLDGAYMGRIKISGNSQDPIIIEAATEGKHTVWIYKATEAHTGAVIIEKVMGENIASLQKEAMPVIEFIGNSITCGAAADPSEVPCGSGEYHDQHNAYMAYGPQLARALNADFVLSSVSGIGAYRNWNSDGPIMPEVYEKIDFQEGNPQLWDFSTFTPQVVSIALGTNDFSNGDGMKFRHPFDSSHFVSNYIGFVKLVKSKYPHTRIALLSSPMLNGNRRTQQQNCLLAIKDRIDAEYPTDQPVALHFFQPMQARGCTGHPNVEDHAILAEELLPFFKELYDFNPSILR